MGTFLAFLGVSLLVIATPGQDTALTIKNTLTGGRRGGIATAFGVSVGQAFWTVAASAGITALLVASEPAFVALKLAGAAYLIYLGGSALRAAIRPPPSAPDAQPGADAKPERGPRPAFRQGVLSNLANPKMAIFFTSLLPQFGGESFAALLALGLIFCALTFVWLTLYAAAITRAKDALARPRIRRTLDAIMGTTLVALGVRLAAERR